MHNPESVLGVETHKLQWYFEIQTDHLIPAIRPDRVKVNKKKRSCRIVDFAVPADHRIKLKESEKTLLENWKLWNVKVMVIPIVIGSLGIVTKGLMQGVEIGGRVETIIVEIGQNTK